MVQVDSITVLSAQNGGQWMRSRWRPLGTINLVYSLILFQQRLGREPIILLVTVNLQLSLVLDFKGIYRGRIFCARAWWYRVCLQRRFFKFPLGMLTNVNVDVTSLYSVLLKPQQPREGFIVSSAIATKIRLAKGCIEYYEAVTLFKVKKKYLLKY